MRITDSIKTYTMDNISVEHKALTFEIECQNLDINFNVTCTSKQTDFINI